MIYGTPTVVGYEGTTGALVIPELYRGLPVNRIINGAFEFDNIYKVVIPRSVSDIGTGPFVECRTLETVEMHAE